MKMRNFARRVKQRWLTGLKVCEIRRKIVSEFAVVCEKLNKMRANDQVYVNKPKFRLFLKNSI